MASLPEHIRNLITGGMLHIQTTPSIDEDLRAATIAQRDWAMRTQTIRPQPNPWAHFEHEGKPYPRRSADGLLTITPDKVSGGCCDGPIDKFAADVPWRCDCCGVLYEPAIKDSHRQAVFTIRPDPTQSLESDTSMADRGWDSPYSATGQDHEYIHEGEYLRTGRIWRLSQSDVNAGRFDPSEMLPVPRYY